MGKSNDTLDQMFSLFKKKNSPQNQGLYHLYIQILCRSTANVSVKNTLHFIMHYTITQFPTIQAVKTRDNNGLDVKENVLQHPHY